jgi:hypothetical protein
VQRQAAHPVVVSDEGVQMFAGLEHEELDELVPAAGEEEGLVVAGHPVGAFLIQLLQGVHPDLWRELVLQKLGVHHLGAGLALDEQYCFDDVVVGEEAQGGCFLVDVPDYDRLVVRAADEGLSILGNGDPPDPVLVAGVGTLAIACADFPELDGLVAGAGIDHVAFGVELHVGHIVVVSEEGLEAEVVVIEVPQLDGEVRGAGGQVAALLIVSCMVDRIYLE